MFFMSRSWRRIVSPSRREHDVQQDHVIRLPDGQGIALVAVLADVHDEALLFEPLFHKGDDLPVVLYEKHAHGATVPIIGFIATGLEITKQ